MYKIVYFNPVLSQTPHNVIRNMHAKWNYILFLFYLLIIKIQLQRIIVQLENSTPKNMLIGLKLFLYLHKKHRPSTSFRHDDGAVKENFHFYDQSKQVVFLFSSLHFSKINTKYIFSKDA